MYFTKSPAENIGPRGSNEQKQREFDGKRGILLEKKFIEC